MAVKVQKMLQRVGEEDFDGVVEEGHSDELAVGGVADTEDVVCELEDAGVLELQAGGGSLQEIPSV